MRFPPGRVVATPGALDALTAAQTAPSELVGRHLMGDWGMVPKEDARENELSLKHGFTLMSSYPLRTGERIWIITEADRSGTTLLLPTEY